MTRPALVSRRTRLRLYAIAVVPMSFVAVGCWGEPEPRRFSDPAKFRGAMTGKAQAGGDGPIAKSRPSGRL
jgi:hypothetical protein